MKIFRFLPIVALITLFACGKENVTPTEQPLSAKTTTNLKADADQPRTNSFTLYRFSDSSIVANSDSATAKWDIGFRGTTIIVNGGTIRSGKGGAYIHTGTFSELTEIPTTATFRGDTTATNLAITTGSGNGWYNYNQATNVISPIAGRVMVIKTADEKYAKVEILSYYKDAPANPTGSEVSRYFTFRYIYQPNGTKKF